MTDYSKIPLEQLMKLRKELDIKSAKLKIENAKVEAELWDVCRALVDYKKFWKSKLPWTDERRAKVTKSMIVRGIWHSDSAFHRKRRPDCRICLKERNK